MHPTRTLFFTITVAFYAACAYVRAMVLTRSPVFAISGRGIDSKLVFNSPNGKLGGSELSFTDKAVSVCPVGAIMPKHLGYETPIGERLYDKNPISIVGDVASHVSTEKPFIGDDSHE